MWSAGEWRVERTRREDGRGVGRPAGAGRPARGRARAAWGARWNATPPPSSLPTPHHPATRLQREGAAVPVPGDRFLVPTVAALVGRVELHGAHSAQARENGQGTARAARGVGAVPHASARCGKLDAASAPPLDRPTCSASLFGPLRRCSGLVVPAICGGDKRQARGRGVCRMCQERSCSTQLETLPCPALPCPACMQLAQRPAHSPAGPQCCWPGSAPRSPGLRGAAPHSRRARRVRAGKRGRLLLLPPPAPPLPPPLRLHCLAHPRQSSPDRSALALLACMQFESTETRTRGKDARQVSNHPVQSQALRLAAGGIRVGVGAEEGRAA